jgi:hypothetical protein
MLMLSGWKGNRRLLRGNPRNFLCRHFGETAMEYKAIQFEIIQTANPCCWKWVVFLDATKT